MTTGHVFIATSLDGFIARKDNQLDWLSKQPTQGEDHGWERFMESVDGLVMGRGTYETVLTLGPWPYRKQVVVMSKTLVQADVPHELMENVRITALDPPELMHDLKNEGWSRAYIDGGRVVQSFLRRGLIQDLVLTTIPILIGEGIRLFGEVEGDIDLELLGTTSFESGLVQARYGVKDSGSRTG